MLIIPIDYFNKNKGAAGDPTPKMQMLKKGMISLNKAAADLMKLSEGVNYIHFYEDGDDLYCKSDFDQTHALKMNCNLKAAKFSVYGKNTVQYFLNKIDKDAEKLVFEMSDADFGKFKMTIQTIN